MPVKNLPNVIPDTPRSPASAKRRIHPSIPFIVVLFVLLYAGINAWIFFYGTSIFSVNPFLKKTVDTVSVIKQQGGGGLGSLVVASPTPKPRPVYPLPAGPQEWTVQYGPAAKGPKIQKVTVDTLTPGKGGKQTVTIFMKNDAPVTSAKATLITDHARQDGTFKLASGSAADGAWSLTWTIKDTYDYTFRIDLALENSSGKWTGTLAFR